MTDDRARCQLCGCLAANHDRVLPAGCRVCSCPGYVERKS